MSTTPQWQVFFKKPNLLNTFVLTFKFIFTKHWAQMDSINIEIYF